MPEFMNNCPRCATKQVTFDVRGDVLVKTGWNYSDHEVFSKCRICGTTSIFEMRHVHTHGDAIHKRDGAITGREGSIDDLLSRRHISVRDAEAPPPPQHVPAEIELIFKEGASSFVAGCYNAAGAMFRLCLDMTTKRLLPRAEDNPENQPNRDQRTKLFSRLGWLFDNDKLANDLRGLAECLREDGNDAAHDGTLTKDDAEDLLDFTIALLTRVFTEPARITMAEARRRERRERP